MDKLYTCDEVAARYDVKTLTVWDWIRRKRLTAIKVGKSYRIREEDIAAFEAAHCTIQSIE